MKELLEKLIAAYDNLNETIQYLQHKIQCN